MYKGFFYEYKFNIYSKKEKKKITSEIYTDYEISKYKGLRVARFESNLERNSEKMEYTRFQGPLP